MDKKYSLIYADCPWRYDRNTLTTSAELQYSTMSQEKLCALPVGKIAAKDSVLFLWATFPMIHEALEVIKAWGFQYKTVGFVWVKQNPKSLSWYSGIGFWTRSNAEICLIAKRGNLSRISRKVSQLIIAPRREHSRKPDEARDKIVELMGDLPRIELFARQKTEGWDAWGSEVESDIEIEGYPVPLVKSQKKEM